MAEHASRAQAGGRRRHHVVMPGKCPKLSDWKGSRRVAALRPTAAARPQKPFGAMALSVDTTDDAVAANQPVCVSSGGRVGPSGTVVAGRLLRHGFPTKPHCGQSAQAAEGRRQGAWAPPVARCGRAGVVRDSVAGGAATRGWLHEQGIVEGRLMQPEEQTPGPQLCIARQDLSA